MRTRELLSRFLLKPPACVVDVGGGARIHSFWLAEQGYDVHLIDAVSHHIETAKSVAKQRANPPVSMQVGGDHKLHVDDGIADAVLLLGPLYHPNS